MPKVCTFKMVVANGNFTTRTPFLSYNQTLLASKTSKQETLDLQVCSGEGTSRKFAATGQERRSFRQTRPSPFSVFMFDFRMKWKLGSKRGRFERSAAWYWRGIPPDQAWQSYHRSKHWSEGVVWMAIQDVHFIVVSNETNANSICADKCPQIGFSVQPLQVKIQRTLGDLGVCCCDWEIYGVL